MEACKTLLERLKPFREKLGEKAAWSDVVEMAHLQDVDLQATHS